MDGGKVVESCLHAHLHEHINAEVVLGTIKSVSQAEEWLCSSYLHCRLQINPSHYGFDLSRAKGLMKETLSTMAATRVGVVSLVGGEEMRATRTGRLMSRYYLTFVTMKRLCGVLGLHQTQGELPELLAVLCGCKELSDTLVRVAEKKTLNNLNRNKAKETIRFPLEGKVKNSEMKVNILIQTTLGMMFIPDSGLMQEVAHLVKLAQRLATCLVELVIHSQERENLVLVKSCYLLLKSLSSGIWHDSQHLIKQMPRVGPVISSALVKASYTTFTLILAADARQLEVASGKSVPFGNTVMQWCRQLPRYVVEVHRLGEPAE